MSAKNRKKGSTKNKGKIHSPVTKKRNVLTGFRPYLDRYLCSHFSALAPFSVNVGHFGDFCFGQLLTDFGEIIFVSCKEYLKKLLKNTYYSSFSSHFLGEKLKQHKIKSSTRIFYSAVTFSFVSVSDLTN